MTSHKAIVSGISGRYAVALFELADEAKALDAVESDLSELKAMMEESVDMRDLVSSPLYSREQQSNGVAGVAKAAKLQGLTEKFLGVLAANRRLNALGAIISSFEKLLAHHRGEVKAEVVSARKLTKKQLGDLEKKLKSAVGHDVAIDASVDESLLGGLTVQVGSRMVDDSLKTKLNNLAIAMKGVQ
ncbi:F0F1 ATP synthase subunit delta [Kordiimonas aestuarii]|uniref:F0F1 ATP synthase subunit delta n=1 Tax=Kordiimonas aestuarii TaxID=1005925 RepID=UPI0021CF1050|nr:F0F1 ATP synthase subunit delta [Kordiimonas aestuarii]